MNVVGLRTRTGTPATAPSVARARSARRNGGSCQCSATASARRKPALWRVAAYSGPGFPRPTTARRAYSSFLPLGFSSAFGAPLPSGAAAGGASPSSPSLPSRTLRNSSGSAASGPAPANGAAPSPARVRTTTAILRSEPGGGAALGNDGNRGDFESAALGP